MRIFQNSGLYPSYRRYFDIHNQASQGFEARLKAFLNDRYGAAHFLLPVLQSDPEAFFTNGDDEVLQRAWARESGLPDSSSLDDILLAQIEAHRTEVFYNLDPVRYASDFVRRLPGCVKKAVCWRAAPSSGADFSAYDLIVCNFPSIIESWRRLGWRAGYLAPAYDSELDSYAVNSDRFVDVLFIGGYSRHHIRRAQVLEAVAQLATRYQVTYCLDESRLTRLADSPLGLFPGLSRHRRPVAVREISVGPVYGRELYRMMSQAKIVLNGAIDMAGQDRGNMRCFETLGCGALMISDHGNYPEGFINGETMLTYCNAEDATEQVANILENWSNYKSVALTGWQMVRSRYGKDTQWENFQELVS